MDDTPYPEIDVAERLLERLRALEVMYPINVHKWRNQEGLLLNYIINTKHWMSRGVLDKTEDLYARLSRYNVFVERYITDWIKENVSIPSRSDSV